MIRASHNRWTDVQTGDVIVDHVHLKNGDQRWRVLQREKTKKKSWFVLVSKHLTPEMAVIMAQRLANRLLRQKRK